MIYLQLLQTIISIVLAFYAAVIINRYRRLGIAFRYLRIRSRRSLILRLKTLRLPVDKSLEEAVKDKPNAPLKKKITVRRFSTNKKITTAKPEPINLLKEVQKEISKWSKK